MAATKAPEWADAPRAGMAAASPHRPRKGLGRGPSSLAGEAALPKPFDHPGHPGGEPPWFFSAEAGGNGLCHCQHVVKLMAEMQTAPVDMGRLQSSRVPLIQPPRWEQQGSERPATSTPAHGSPSDANVEAGVMQ